MKARGLFKPQDFPKLFDGLLSKHPDRAHEACDFVSMLGNGQRLTADSGHGPTDPKERRARGSKRVAVLGNEDLFKLLGCNDIDVLIAKLTALNVVLLCDTLTTAKEEEGSNEKQT